MITAKNFCVPDTVIDRRDFLAGAVSSMLAPQLAQAWQPWPVRPVVIDVPFTPGSAVDLVARMVAEQMTKQLNQSFVVLNRLGAGGFLAMQALRNSSADGYEFLAYSPAMLLAPHTMPAAIEYKPLKDFILVATLATMPNVLVVSPNLGVRDVGQFIEKAKKERLRAATVGFGTANHIAIEKFALAAGGLQFDIIPYQGAPQILNDLMADRIDCYSAPVSIVGELIKAGKIGALMVSSAERLTVLPDVPTSASVGLQDSDFNLWVALFAKAGTTPDIVERLNNRIGVALKNLEVAEQLIQQGVIPMPMNVEESARFFRSENDRVTEVVRALKLVPH